MKKTLLVSLTITFLASGGAFADPISLNNAQMDGITAGDLTTPGNTVFEGFDNPAPGEFHPNFDRSPTAIDATTGHGPSLSGAGNEGPWSPHVVSPVITCADC